MTSAEGLRRGQATCACLQFPGPLVLHSPRVRRSGASRQTPQSRQVSTTSKVFILEQRFPLIANAGSVLSARMFPTNSFPGSMFPEGQRGRKHFRNLGTRSNPWLNLSSALGPGL